MWSLRYRLPWGIVSEFIFLKNKFKFYFGRWCEIILNSERSGQVPPNSMAFALSARRAHGASRKRIFAVHHAPYPGFAREDGRRLKRSSVIRDLAAVVTGRAEQGPHSRFIQKHSFAVLVHDRFRERVEFVVVHYFFDSLPLSRGFVFGVGPSRLRVVSLDDVVDSASNVLNGSLLSSLVAKGQGFVDFSHRPLDAVRHEAQVIEAER
jgi:hypothetical protein